MDTVSGELGVNARRPVGAAAALMNVADARLEHLVALPAPRRLAVSPRVEPARGDAEHAGHRGGAVAGLIRSHELERFPGAEPVSRANQAAAFASISRSSRSRRFSRRRRRSSSRSALGARQPIVAATFVEIGLADPVTDGLVRALELAGELSDRAP